MAGGRITRLFSTLRQMRACGAPPHHHKQRHHHENDAHRSSLRAPGGPPFARTAERFIVIDGA